jgi:TonB family protein
MVGRRHRNRSLVGTSLALVGLMAASQAEAQFVRVPDPPPEAPVAPKVVPPRLITFQQAPYPPEAEKAGLTADVVLRLTIDDKGAVTEAEVTEPVGNGFDEAAKEAALKFIFEPALRDGVPTRARILYRYSFTLTPVAAAPSSPTAAGTEPPAAAEVTTGDLEVMLRVTGTDVPLVGAQISVKKPDGTDAAFTSDEQGKVVLKGVPAGSYRLSIRSPGFQPMDSEESVVAKEATEVTLRVSPETEELEVVVQGERPSREVTRRTIERREIDRIPGTSGDAIRSVESLPGVARPPGFTGILLVRGSYPEDTQVYVDGSEIPQIYHFGGLRSVIPTELLSRIDFFPGNYGSRFGRGMGGVVDVGLRTPDTQCLADYGKPTGKSGCFHGLAQVDLIEGRLLLQGPLPVKNWSFAVGARRSWLDAWIGPVLEQSGANIKTLPVYYDYQVIIDHKPDSKSHFSARLFGADDRFGAVIDPLAEEPGFGGNLRFSQTFMQGQLLYETELAPFLSSSTMLSAEDASIGFGIGSFNFDLEFYPVQFRHEFGWKLAKGIRLNTGLDYQVSSYDISVRSPAPARAGEANAGPFSTRPTLEVTESASGLRQGWYAEAELQPFDALRVVPSLRADYSRDTGQTDISPRINARYDLISGGTNDDGSLRRRTTVKGGVGMYYQPPQYQETNKVFGTPGIDSNRAIHYALGIEQELTAQLDLGVEAFYKDLDHLVAAAPPDSLNAYSNLGTGRVIGLETLLRYKPDKHFFGWIAYTLSRSERRDYAGDDTYLIPYDQTHNFTMLGSYRLGRGWEVGARFRVISGSLVTPVRTTPSLPALYVADAGSYVPLEGEADSQRLPLFHQLDLRLDKRWQFRAFRLSAYLDVYNAYNNAATEGVSYDYNYARQVYTTGVPFLPSIGVRGEF